MKKYIYSNSILRGAVNNHRADKPPKKPHHGFQ